jgi:hypothetical protein
LREEAANVAIGKLRTSPLLDNCFLVPHCVLEWTEPYTGFKLHRLFAADITRKYADAETREGQGPLEEGSPFGGDVDFIQLQTSIAESGHGCSLYSF